MKRHPRICSCFLVVPLAALIGCSSKPAATESQKAASAPDRIQGKAQVLEESSSLDRTLNAGGSSVYIWEGIRRNRLFFKTTTPVTHGDHYLVEGVNAQKAIDEIGDPDQGKNGYPLLESCAKVVRTTWPGMSFEDVDTRAAALRSRVQRYPARPVFLVKRILPADETQSTGVKKVSAEEKNIPEMTVDAAKQKALLVEGATTLPAPLWEPKGGTQRCKVIIGTDGKVDELETGAQLCESVDWGKFKYQPTTKAGKAAKVSTEVEITFEPRK